jgi:Flp pilus assembly protein TadG
MTLGRRLWKSEQGVELIEFALVLPMLLLVVLGIVEFGFLFQRYEVLSNAAREGARMAVLPGYTEPDIDTRVVAYANASGVNNPALTAADVLVQDANVAMGVGPAIRCKRVIVNYTYTFRFIPGVGAMFGGTFTTVPLQAVSVMRIEDQ